MSEDDWKIAFAKSIGIYLDGTKLPGSDSMGKPIVDDSFYILFNAHHNPLGFILPPEDWGRRWAKVLDTTQAMPVSRKETYRAGEAVRVEGRSLMLLRRIG